MAEGDGNKGSERNAEKLRQLFLSKYSGNLTNGLYDDRDVDRYQKNDGYVESFIRDFETMQDAADRLHESLKFRLELSVNDLKADSFPDEVWEKGAMFYHSTDKDGHKVLYVRVKEHKKDPQLLPLVKRFFTYHIELEYKANPDKQIVVLLDMVNAGLSNLDMELIRFILTTFKVYYPISLAYLLVFEMPWLFNAAWKIIKTWMSQQAIQKLKFVTRSDIQAYIDKDQVLEHMGGTNKFVYKYEPPQIGLEEEEVDKAGARQKRVTFADHESPMYKSLSNDSIKDQDTKSSPRTPSSILGRSRTSVAQSRRMSRDDNSFIGRLLTISPAEELEFVIEDGVKESTDVIMLKNTLPYSIAYKVKTTSPEKYRVRPSSGVVKAGTQVEVVVCLQQGYQNTVHKDKFLVMAMEMRDDSGDSTSDMWRSVQKDSIMEHRLRCVVCNSRESGVEEGEAGAVSSPLKTSQLLEKVDKLVESSQRLQRTVKVMMVCQMLLVLVLLCTVYFMVESPTPAVETDTCPAGSAATVSQGSPDVS